MARMKRKRKYRSSAFSKSSWNKRMSCRQNMHKARIKANAKARAKNSSSGNFSSQMQYDPIGTIMGAIILFIFTALVLILGIYNYICIMS